MRAFISAARRSNSSLRMERIVSRNLSGHSASQNHPAHDVSVCRGAAATGGIMFGSPGTNA
jgi:hypothetical protein